jgi:hypothetical protein
MRPHVMVSALPVLTIPIEWKHCEAHAPPKSHIPLLFSMHEADSWGSVRFLTSVASIHEPAAGNPSTKTLFDLSQAPQVQNLPTPGNAQIFIFVSLIKDKGFARFPAGGHN